MKFSTASATKAVTLNGMAELCAKAAGVEPNVINYDPASVPDLEVKKGFPVPPDPLLQLGAKAQAVLGWWPKHPDLSAELKERLAYYKSIGRDKKEMSFEIDDKILAAIGKVNVCKAVKYYGGARLLVY